MTDLICVTQSQRLNITKIQQHVVNSDTTNVAVNRDAVKLHFLTLIFTQLHRGALQLAYCM